MRGSDYADLKAVALIARLGSFSAAARMLAVSPSALSQRVRELEARLGVRLFNRTTRSVAVTEQGAVLLGRTVPLFDEIDRAVADLAAGAGGIAGPLRLNLPRLAATHLVAPLLGAFHRAHPAVTLEISVDDSFSDIVSGHFDAGIRLGESLEKDMVAVKLGAPRRAMVVASPDLLDRLGRPERPEDLHRFPCIRFRWPGAGSLYRWEFERDGKALEIAVDGPLIANDTAVMLAAAQQGLGLAYLLDLEAGPLLGQGALTSVLADWLTPFGGFHLYHPSNRQMPPPLRAFIDFLKEKLAEGGGG